MKYTRINSEGIVLATGTASDTERPDLADLIHTVGIEAVIIRRLSGIHTVYERDDTTTPEELLAELDADEFLDLYSLPHGRCDTCGAPCLIDGCSLDPTHAVDRFASMADRAARMAGNPNGDG